MDNYSEKDLPQMVSIWNEVVADGEAFPQEELLDQESGKKFFSEQTLCRVFRDGADCITGLYILHPNNVGRCGHICNASYAVARAARGKGIGAILVQDSLACGKKAGFRILQFNAVVADNIPAHKLYRRLGFTPLGTVPGGFRNRAGLYRDIQLYFIELV